MVARRKQFLDDINKWWGLCIICLIVTCAVIIIWNNKASQVIYSKWENQIDNVGFKSPVLLDINSDNVLDIVTGTGYEWGPKNGEGVIAVDGNNGGVIWGNRFQASPHAGSIAMDINKDGIKDVSVSGRFADFFMLNGKDGRILWSIKSENKEIMDQIASPATFSTPIIIDDIDQDSVPDIVVIQGGGLENNSDYIKIVHVSDGSVISDTYNFFEIERNINNVLKNNIAKEILLDICKGGQCKRRSVSRTLFEKNHFEDYISELFDNQLGPVGYVYLISGETGKIRRVFKVPEGRESWGVPTYYRKNDQQWIIYGTGSQYKGGGIVAQNLVNGEMMWYVETNGKGVMGSPILYQDNTLVEYVVVNTIGGQIFKINAANGDIVWRSTVGEGYHSITSMAPAKLFGKKSLDFIALYSKEKKSEFGLSKMFIINGKTGEIIKQEMVGQCHNSNSPLVADIDNDMKDDIILVNCFSRDVKLSVYNNSLKEIVTMPLNSGGYSNPIVADMDGNGKVDILVSRLHFINRYETIQSQTSSVNVRWGTFHGSVMNGTVDGLE